MKKHIRLFSYCTTLALSTLVLHACDSTEPAKQELLRSVKYRIIEKGNLANTRVFSGTVRSAQQSRLSFKVSGNIAQLPIKVGDRLAKDQLIAKLDSSTYELEAERSRASLAQTKAAERNAKSTYERTKKLYENDNASRLELDTTRANAESAAAQTKAAEKAMALAKLNVSYTELRSPFNCTAASIDAEINENISSGTPIVTADCGDELETEIALPESLINKIKKNQAVTIRIDSQEKNTFNGKIDEIGTAIESSASTFPVTVSINDPEKKLRPGLAAEVSLDLQTQKNDELLYVSVSSVNGDEQGSYVYIAEPTNTATANENKATVRKRRVVTGELTSDGLQILSGLQVGDRLITAGVKTIRPEMTVLLSQ